MKTRGIAVLALSACIYGFSGCKDQTVTVADAIEEIGKLLRGKSTERASDHAAGQVTEHIDANEKAEAAKLKPAKDPIWEEIDAFQMEIRRAYNNRAFDELEKRAAELRPSKATFGNGSWKIVQFYGSFSCDDDEPESMWELHDRIHQEWITAKPESIAARVAYADFFTEYAWRARGRGYANTVSQDGWRLFRERMASARKVLDEARNLQEKDPYWWRVALQVARGQGWPKDKYDALVVEAKAFEPKFWGYDTERAFSLLPRWYGEPGDWEAYAEEVSSRPDGLGPEAYARIAIYLRGFHDNIFRESQASWPKIREGLQQMCRKYPDSIEIVSNAALLASTAQDREFAKEMFDRLGDTYLPGIWRKPERFVHCRNWANTGKW